jgi:hypothetical protein
MHFAATCRTAKHLVDLYLRSLRDGNKKPRYEAHFNQATEKDKEAVFLTTMHPLSIWTT